MVGVLGEVGNRVFLFQAREADHLVTIKCEKVQLSALAQWLAQVIEELGRPGHLPDDLSLEAPDEFDFVVGEIAVALDEDDHTVEVTFQSSEEDDSLIVTLSREWVGALAIAITRLVEAGRPLCPLCAGPLDPQGHDCPRTNGHRPPIR